MATKKSVKKQNNKNKKALEDEHKRMGKLVVIFGVLLVCILAVFFAVKSELFCDTADQQKILAFKGLATSYLISEFEKEDGQTILPGEMGITDDKDLYIDFVIVKYEDHVIVSSKNARLHFQCHDENFKLKENGCAHAFWYDEEKETSEENREAQREFNDALEALTDATNSGADEAVLKHLREEYEKTYENVKPFFSEVNALPKL